MLKTKREGSFVPRTAIVPAAGLGTPDAAPSAWTGTPSTAAAYSTTRRPGTATRVLVEGGRARGVEYTVKDKPAVAYADREVVLATHDARLGAAARALGLRTVGTS